MYIYYIYYIMPRNNRSSNNLPKNNLLKNNLPKNNLPVNNTSSTLNTVKDAVIYSSVFYGTQRLMDNIFGNRKVDVVQNNDYCDKIKEKYNNDKYNEFLELEYQKCFK